MQAVPCQTGVLESCPAAVTFAPLHLDLGAPAAVYGYTSMATMPGNTGTVARALREAGKDSKGERE